MLTFTDDPRVRLHLAVALRAHMRQLRRDGARPPADLLELVDALSSGVFPTDQQASNIVPLSASGDADAAPVLLTRTEAARRLGLSEMTVRRLGASGELPEVRIGRSVRIRAEDVEAFGQRKAAG